MFCLQKGCNRVQGGLIVQSSVTILTSTDCDNQSERGDLTSILTEQDEHSLSNHWYLRFIKLTLPSLFILDFMLVSSWLFDLLLQGVLEFSRQIAQDIAVQNSFDSF